MKHSSWSNLIGILLIFLIALSCNLNKEKENKKVIVIHARGITYPDMIYYLDTLNISSFFKSKDSKKQIKKLHPITNAVTISNISSFETGVNPSDHGIIGHAYALRENDTLLPVSGFSQRFEKETFWEKADSNSRKVLKIGDLTFHGKYTKHTNVHCLGQGAQTSKARNLTLSSSRGIQGDEVIRYVSEEGYAHFTLQKDYADSIKIYQINDDTDNAYLYFDNDYVNSNGFIARAKQGSWLEIPSEKNSEALQAFRLKWSKSKNKINLYVRPSFENRGYSDAFIKQIDNNLGPPKGWPNIPLYTSGIIDDKTLVEEINEEVDYVMDVFKFATNQEKYDLIMIDYPLMDRLGHSFLQLKSSSEKIQKHYANAFTRMEEDFASIANYAKKNNYELILTSGHGFSPIHTSIDPNIFLRKNNIKIDVQNPDWEAFGLIGKVSVHIYINENLSNYDRELVSKKIESLFKTLIDENSKQQVIDEIYGKEDLIEIGLSHKNAGDLFVLLKPGYVFSNNEKGNVFGSPTFKGDHGYSLKYEDSYGILVANSECSRCKSTDISEMIGKILKLE